MGALTLRQARPRNSHQEGFEQRLVRKSPPKGAFDLLDNDTLAWAGIVDPEWLHVTPWGIGNPGGSFSLRMWGWSEVEDRKLLSPLPLGEVRVTLGDINSSAIEAGALMSDSISVREPSNQEATVIVFNHGKGLQSHFIFNALSSRLIEFEFANSPTTPVKGMNAFWKVGR